MTSKLRGCVRLTFIGISSIMVSVALSCSSIAIAREPVPDSGRIDVGPGWRYEPHHRSNSIGGAGRFSWQMDRRWFLGIELGASSGSLDVDLIGLEDPASVENVRVVVGDLRVALGAHLVALGSGWLYSVAGGGYHVVGVTEDGRYREGATQGVFLGVGVYFPVSERIGLFIEDRWTFFSRVGASIGRESVVIDAGGNLLWGGVVLFFEPERRPGGLTNRLDAR